MLTFNEFISLRPDMPPHERALLKQAYDVAQKAHEGQKRRSGEDYFVHCIEVARILMELGLDASAIAAGLLHDVVEDTPLTIDDLQEIFGEEIAALVFGVTKIEQITVKAEQTVKEKTTDREAEFLRKTLLAMTDDVRVILIKLADRLHNMYTLGHLSPEQQQRIARETMDIFAPLANRLGIWQMKWELEDLAFRYLEPDLYKMIASLIAERRGDRDYYVNKVVDKLKKLLAEHDIKAEISGRSKHIYSIWRKMERKSVPFEELFDVRAVRVIVSDVPTCYQVLGYIHQTWRPIAGEFDDYIAAPKDNFYQSLHTAVFLEDGKTLEVQIRTPEMHIHAEYGIAAHWRYKESGARYDEAFQRRLQYLREMIDVGQSYEDPTEFIDAIRSDVFQDRVYVFTPHGDIIDLPYGATPIDFAYHIHTDIGHRCRGAKVNNKLVPLDYVLQVGDRVQILTAKRGGPSRDWLNPSLNYIKTKRALSKIRHWFRRQDRDKMIALGREILDRELKRLGLDQKLTHDQVAELAGFDKTDDMLAQLGFGDMHPHYIASRILELERQTQQDQVPSPAATKPAAAHDPDGIRIQGTGGLLTNLAKCCTPVRGDEIIGYITRGRGVTIHRADCPNILNLPSDERLIAVEWAPMTPQTEESARYPVPVVINAYDREGLMRDIGAAIADEHINMRDVSIRTQNHIATFSVTMEVESTAQLSQVLSKIERLPNVMDVRRRTN